MKNLYILTHSKKNKKTLIIKEGIILLGLLIVTIITTTGCGRTIYQTEQENSAGSSALEGQEEIDVNIADAGKDIQGTSDNEIMEELSEAVEPEVQEAEVVSYIQEEGQILCTRIKEPEGYERTEAEADSFAEFIRNYPMKPDKSPVLLYDGHKKANQSVHAAVFEMYLEQRDLQQCADSIMRIYAEYFYQKESYDNITFHLVSGFVFDFDTWRQGNKLMVDGNAVSWTGSENDSSEESFERYLRTLFTYASTLSMEQESEEIAVHEIEAGDIFIKGGSPGHVVMVADVCVNQEGEKAFLLAQGYMPAQEFHIIKNPLHEEDPWYYISEITYPFLTPEYSFREGSLKRPIYLSGK